MSDRTIPQDSTYDVATFKLLSAGQDVTQAYAILSLVVNRVVNRIPTARVVIRDGSTAAETFAASESDDFAPGKELEIAMGFDSDDQVVFKGIIVKQSLKVGSDGNSRLILDCRDHATKLTIGRHSRYFTDSLDSDAIETILGEYDQVSGEVEATQVTHPSIVQYHATDWDFILSRAEMNGQIVIIEDGSVKVKSPATDDSPFITLTYGANILEFETEMEARFQYQAVKARAWNYADQALVEVEASEPTLNQQGDLSGADLAAVVGLESLELRHGGDLSESELQAWADAQLLKSRLAKIRGHIKTKGYLQAKPDAVIELAGAGTHFNGSAYVSGVRHDFSYGAWYTHLQLGLAACWFYQATPDILEPPASGLLPGVNGLQIGVVMEPPEDDPDGEGRVFVKLPTLEPEAEGLWARIATLDAGVGRGAYFRPEVEDEVVLGFLDDDPRKPVILGMLHSSARPAPWETTDGNPQKGFVTRSELKLMFDDETQVITLETPGGNILKISDEDAGCQLKDQNENTVTLNDTGITLKSAKDLMVEAAENLTLKAGQDITLQGMNLTLAADAELKASGSGGVEVSSDAIATLKGGGGVEVTSDAIATLKGSLVKIN